MATLIGFGLLILIAIIAIPIGSLVLAGLAIMIDSSRSKAMGDTKYNTKRGVVVGIITFMILFFCLCLWFLNLNIYIP